MRILLISEDVPANQLGGAGQHAVVLGNALLDAGHEVHLLGYRREDGVAGNCGFRGPLHTLIDFRGARWQERRLGAFMPMALPHTARRILRAMRQLPGPWDAVHYHGHNPLLGGLVPKQINFLHSLHDQGAECITKMRFKQGKICQETNPAACAGCASAAPNLAQRWLSTTAVKGLRTGAMQAFQRHQAIFVSDFLRQRFAAVVGDAHGRLKLSVLHNFVDPAKLDTARLESAAIEAAGLPADPDRPLVFGAGRIDEAKGFAALLDSLGQAQLTRMRLVIAGDGPALPALRQRHEARGVTFLGWCSPSRVLALTRLARVCLVPSLCEEACATTVLEALALGRPVFALALGGTPELAGYGEPGQLRLFENMAALVAALNRELPTASPFTLRASVENQLPHLMKLYGSLRQETRIEEAGS